MRVFITKTFKKKYFLKHKSINILQFVEKIKKYDFILLKFPFLKFKFNLDWIAYRWVVLKTKSWDFIPLILCFKKDKSCWENVIWEKFKNKILKSQDDSFFDLKNWDFEIY